MIKPLQSLRFIAIVGVFLSHLSYLQTNSSYSTFFNRYFYDGYCGVTFFLVLSGFVIAYNYYDRIQENSLKTSLEFTLKRIKRLYPIHILTFLITVPLAYKIILATPLSALVGAISNMTLTQSFIPIKSIYFSYNGVAWYLSLTMFFCLFTPLLISFIKKLQCKNINLLLVAICIYIIQFSLVYIGRDSNNSHWLFYVNPFFRALDYLSGMLLSVIMINKIKIKSKKPNLNVKYTVIELVSVLLFTLAYYFYPYINPVFRFGVYYMPFMLLLIYVFSLQNGYLSKILSNNVLVYLGNISFEFYMIHQLVIRIVSLFMAVNHPIGTAVISFIIALGISAFVHKYFTYTRIITFKNRIVASQ